MSLPYLVLGVLKYGPLSGYDLNKAFSDSVRHFWNTEQSQIYRALYKLEAAGWVAAETVVQEGGPNKKLYQLTGAGQAELHRWLATPLALPAPHEGWLGQLFFGAELSRAEFIGLLEARIAQIRPLIPYFESQIPAVAAGYAAAYQAPADLPFWLLTADHGLQRLRFELDWAQQTLRGLCEPESEQEVT